MPDAVVVPFFAAAGLLIAAGVGKAARPIMTASALQTARIPGGLKTARAMGVAEFALGLACLVVPSPLTAGLLAAVYAGFAVFVLLLMRAGYREVSCGCFGVRPARLSYAHVGFDLGAATFAAAAALYAPADIASFLSSRPLEGAPAAACIALAVYLSFLVLTELPDRWTGPRSETRSATQQTSIGGTA